MRPTLPRAMNALSILALALSQPSTPPDAYSQINPEHTSISSLNHVMETARAFVDNGGLFSPEDRRYEEGQYIPELHPEEAESFLGGYQTFLVVPGLKAQEGFSDPYKLLYELDGVNVFEFQTTNFCNEDQLREGRCSREGHITIRVPFEEMDPNDIETLQTVTRMVSGNHDFKFKMIDHQLPLVISGATNNYKPFGFVFSLGFIVLTVTLITSSLGDSIQRDS